MRSSNIGYVPQLDHLRALAAVWILLYHGMLTLGTMLKHGTTAGDAIEWYFIGNPFLALIREGHVAVSLFMVLSGFIFTYGALGKTLLYRPFIINRLLRIYPLYVVMLLFGLSANPYTFSLSSVAVTLLPISDFAMTSAPPVVHMSWAIAVEFQFYLLFPFLLARLNEGAVRTVVGIIVAATLFRMLGVGLWANPRDLSYWHLAGRIDQFALGMGAAVLMVRLRDRVALWRGILLFSIPLVIATIFGFHWLGGWNAVGNWKVFWPTVEGLMFAALICGYAGTPEFWPKPIRMILTKVGEASFSIYLLHVPVILAFSLRPRYLLAPTADGYVNGLINAALLVLPTVLAFSMITFRVIELPFLRLRRAYLVEREPGETASVRKLIAVP